MEALIVSLQSVWNDSGFEGLTSGNVIMLLVGLIRYQPRSIPSADLHGRWRYDRLRSAAG